MRLTSFKEGAPELLVTIWRDKGIKIASSITKQSPLDMLLSDLEKAYSTRFPDFKKLSERQLLVAERSAAMVIFFIKVYRVIRFSRG